MKELITLSHLRLLATRLLEYCKEHVATTTLDVSDDGDGNVTVTVAEKQG